MKYLPPLSEKAEREIFRIIQLRTDIYQLSDAFYEGLQDLFDTERYPISQDMLVNYIENNLSAKRNYDYPIEREYVILDDSKSIYANVHLEISIFNPVLNQYQIEKVINRLAKIYNTSEMFIIGEIHGWWEQSVTE